MSRRTERVGNLLRELIAEALMRRIADPRIDPGRTTITRVEDGGPPLTCSRRAIMVVARLILHREVPMARNNFKSEKRRKELQRQKKNEEKRLRRLQKKEGADDSMQEDTDQDQDQDQDQEQDQPSE